MFYTKNCCFKRKKFVFLFKILHFKINQKAKDNDQHNDYCNNADGNNHVWNKEANKYKYTNTYN